MPSKKPRPKPRLTMNTSVKKPDPIYCKSHPTDEMVFSPAHGYWSCTVTTCDRRQYPKVVLDESGPAVVGEGPLEILCYRDPKTKDIQYVLRGTQNNVVLDVTDNWRKCYRCGAQVHRQKQYAKKRHSATRPERKVLFGNICRLRIRNGGEIKYGNLHSIKKKMK